MAVSLVCRVQGVGLTCSGSAGGSLAPADATFSKLATFSELATFADAAFSELAAFGADSLARGDESRVGELPPLSDRMYLLISLRESTPPQNRQLHILISDSER